MNGPERDDAYVRWVLLNDAIKLGYLWAKAESRFGLKRAAVSAMKIETDVKAGGSRGGKKSAEARLKKRATTWERHARELAVEIRTAQPRFSQDKVADEVLCRWKEADFSPPGHKEIKRLISEMEKAGDLPRRTAPPRKKRK